MKALTRTIIAFAVVSLIGTGSILAQDFVDESARDALAAQREAQVAQKQAEAAQKQAEAAQRQVEVEKTKTLVAALAAPDVPNVPVAPIVPTRAISFKGPWLLGSDGVGSVLVIPTAELKMEELVTMTEDMSVMLRIFEKNLEQAHITTTYGDALLSYHRFSTLIGGRGGAIQGMYLQGYGALFLMRVDFPLSAPPQVKEEEQTEKKEQGDPVWEEVRKDMYEPQEATRRRAEQPEQKYDAGKVENLKTTLVKTLKHAANIRSLKPDESVILTVAGSGEPASSDAMITTMSEIVVNGHTRIVQQPSASRGPSQTVIIIRVKKSDIDSFAKNVLDYEQFRQRIQLFVCPCLGTEAERGDPFGRYLY